MPSRGKERASGATGAQEEARNATDEIDKEIVVDLPDERPVKWRTPGFMRMRFSWNDDERMVIDRAKAATQQKIMDAFPDAFWIMNSIYDLVREPVKRFDPATGEVEIVRDIYGFAEWVRNADGSYVEDFNKMNRRDKEHYIGLISTRLFTWEQIQVEMWADAMFAKAKFEERFAIVYDAPMTGTVDDRNAVAKKDAADERYFAIYMTVLSRRADALTRSLDRISQRLKDVLTAS